MPAVSAMAEMCWSLAIFPRPTMATRITVTAAGLGF
jgi:hypothetical protein